MSTNCAEFNELLSALADGELPEADRGRVQAHLDGCAECRALAGRFRRLDAAVAGGLTPPAVTAERWDRMLKDIKRAGRARDAAVLRPAPVGRLRFAAWTAAAAAAILVAAVLLQPGRRPAGPEYSSAESVTVEASGTVMVCNAPEGGLRLVYVAIAPEGELSGDKAGG